MVYDIGRCGVGVFPPNEEKMNLYWNHFSFGLSFIEAGIADDEQVTTVDAWNN